MSGIDTNKVGPGATNSFQLKKELNMWHQLHGDNAAAEFRKWVKTNEAGRILGRVHLKDGEYKASKLEFDTDGVGSKNYLGAFITLEQAKAAVDFVPVVEGRPLE